MLVVLICTAKTRVGSSDEDLVRLELLLGCRLDNSALLGPFEDCEFNHY
jgi:hypothetical protein